MTPALILHVGAGGIGILSGAAAISVRKGERLHRAFGTLFLGSMMIMSVMAVFLALRVPERGNVLGGAFTFYLVLTAWLTVWRKAGNIGRIEIGFAIVGFGVAALGFGFGLQATNSPTGMMDGAPGPQFFVMAGVAALAAGLDIRVILQRGVSGKRRIARHLWRMCVALFVACGSFFLGQQKVMPVAIQGSPVLFVLALAPLVLMVFWLVRVRVTKRLAALVLCQGSKDESLAGLRGRAL